jgi:hypothetical protein
MKHRTRTARIVCASVVATLALVPAGAYNISAKGRVHERFTFLAEQCAKANGGADCAVPADGKAFKKAGKRWRKAAYSRAVRWPDDPTDQANVLGGAKFVINLALNECEPWLGDGKPFAGLTCNSHFGQFQFMHAMRSSDGESSAQTREMMLEWTRFLSQVVRNEIDPEKNWCEAVAGRGLLSSALNPQGFPYCVDRTKNGKPYKAWTVRTFFTFTCHNPFTSARCNERIGPGGVDMARRNARGALLHMIQDSYSASHTARGGEDEDGPYKPVVTCLPVTRHYLYNTNKPAHADADKFPDFAKCGAAERKVLDPITASARMLVLLDSADGDATEKAVRLIDEGVLGKAS